MLASCAALDRTLLDQLIRVISTLGALKAESEARERTLRDALYERDKLSAEADRLRCRCNELEAQLLACLAGTGKGPLVSSTNTAEPDPEASQAHPESRTHHS